MDAKEKESHSISTDYVLRLMGLEQAADTIIGSADIRGVSGGQKKRVTTAEQIVGPKKVIFAGARPHRSATPRRCVCLAVCRPCSLQHSQAALGSQLFRLLGSLHHQCVICASRVLRNR